jgi:ribosomal-protein-alanine N-acetyltransferase
MTIVLRPCNGEAELCDPAVTGKFARQMAQLAATVQVPPWCGHIGWLGARPMGFGGFVAPPDQHGVVEIGYLTFPDNEGTGVATAIAAQLVAIARSNGARQVLAHTLPQESASTRVLVRNAFLRDGDAIDPDEGMVWRWRLLLPPLP